MMKKFVELFDL